ncbi:MAG: hypothetical protein C4B59_07915 [Candidatus Methanogaster sp.]|uniref:Uncharacterized protein n=1 Tax=Candidatus Methanogaster sp. TaxID=3386292 RepID=A0AC61L2R5_9EURY|nr:MAG: hypothetical protein C4B59_07915 [ANME-2 cluster archaeon]
MDRPKQSSQQIILNRTRFNSIEFETGHVELVLPRGRDVKFPIGISNYGAPTQLNLTASNEIEDCVRFLHNDFAAVGKTVVDAIIRIRTQRHGSIVVTAGYGANTDGFDIDLIAEPYQEIDADPDLAVPGESALRSREVSPLPSHQVLKVVAALAFILVVLKLFTNMVPGYVGIAAAIMLLVILIMYKLFTTSSQ